MKRNASKAAAATATRTVCYCRVSTTKQVEEGVSLEAQRAKLEAYASLYDLQIVECIVDAGVSAKTLDRPGLARALDLLRTGKADALLVVKLDRLTRSVRDLGELIETHFAPGKSALLSVSENIDTRSAGGRLVLNVLASVSQWEREAIGERTSAAMQHMRSEGQFTGGRAPYGHRVSEDGSTLEADEAEQAVITTVREAKERGLSIRDIVRELAAVGIVGRTGKPLAITQVGNILRAS
ncbi:MAG: recombinase family protein [Deltaproteobacteria bacterium]|nr:recombinase family protein [Deltaproteobacteria bacterium]